ncbi:MAG: HD domain-containing protein [Ignavibacteriae bacterium]|nr:HD domain-containing protein [Ignavibacteriota bacterium]
MLATWTTLTPDTDKKVIAAISRFPESHRMGFLALGSYGRSEMVTYSDVDILILRSDGFVVPDEVVRSVVQLLQDSIPRMSVVARSPSDCLMMLDKDIRSWLTLLEARFLGGDKRVFVELKEGLFCQVRSLGVDKILRSAGNYFSGRREIHGDSSKLLEPNVKNSAGSLRDIHALYYAAILRGWQKEGYPAELRPNFPESVFNLPLTEEQREAVIQAWMFFQNTRDAMHVAVGHLHDTLEYDLQRHVAEKLGYGSKTEKVSVERYMTEYYRQSKAVIGIYDRVYSSYSDDIPSEKVSEKLLRKNVMEFFLECATNNRLPSIKERDILTAEASASGLFFNSEDDQAFDTLLRQKSTVGKMLRIMNDYGILGSYIPEFGLLAQFFQHNIYHFYTADEHTLIALEKCERLVDRPGFLGSLFRSFPDPSVLYYSILFHDIAKPVDLATHEITGAETARKVLQKIGRDDIAEDVAFAVRYHLLMEQTAFRRNYHDKATLLPFARTVGSIRRLNILYLLTYADLSALNPNVWTDWKNEVLQELYSKTEECILLGLDESERLLQEKIDSRVGSALSSGSVFGEEWTYDIDGSRENQPDVQAAIDQVYHGSAGVVVFREQSSYSEAVFVCQDAPYLLSRIAAVLLAADASVIDARIRTRPDGTVVDVFKVVDLIHHGPLRSEQRAVIEEQTARVLTLRANTEELFRQHRSKWKRILRKSTITTAHTAVTYHQHVTDTGTAQTIVDVFAPDTLGLLYRLTQTISSFRLNIHHAKIATRVDGVVDSFYVADVDGMPIDDAPRQQELRAALLEQIRLLTMPESGPVTRV